MSDANTTETELTEVKKTKPTEPAANEQTHDHKHILGLVVVGLVFLLLLGGAFVAGHRAVINQRSVSMRRFSGDTQLSPNSLPSQSYGGFRGGMMDDGQNSSNTTSNTHVSGVVTAVDGDTVTVAGGGTTTKVSISSNTTYSGSTEPAKVNDTIFAIGAKNSDGTLVASSVRLSRQ